VDAKSKTSHTANDISWKVKKHVPGKPIGRMGNQSLLCRQCTPLVISQHLSVALSGVAIKKGVQNFECLSLRSTTNQLRSIGSQFNKFC
jgi:hypothetical protein